MGYIKSQFGTLALNRKLKIAVHLRNRVIKQKMPKNWFCDDTAEEERKLWRWRRLTTLREEDQKLRNGPETE